MSCQDATSKYHLFATELQNNYNLKLDKMPHKKFISMQLSYKIQVIICKLCQYFILLKAIIL